MPETRTTEFDSGEATAKVKSLVSRHSVNYEVWPHVELLQGRPTKVGFDVDLCGLSENADRHPFSDSSHCMATFEHLRRVADAILPPQAGPVRCEVQPYDGALHSSPRRKLRPEVVLSIVILHRNDFEQPVDAAEERCLKQMCKRLEQLGAQPGN